MKKAKLMLFAIVILAVVATAFAFKANKFSRHYIYTGTKGSRSCTTKVNGAAIMSGTPKVAASTVSTTIGCPDAFTVKISD